MTDAFLSHDREASQRRDLRRMRMVALGLLLLAAAIFAATLAIHDPPFWVRLVRAGAEAAMVGGLADWFAVTALFRRPLGLPIPHTALIPSNKDRIGDSLGQFVEGYMLTPDNVAAKLRSIDIAGRLAAWLASPENARAVADRLSAALPAFVRAANDPELRGFFRSALERQLRDANLAPWIGRGLDLLTAGGHHQRLFDRAIGLARQSLADRWVDIHAKVEQHSYWFIPSSVERKIAHKIIDAVDEFLTELEQPDSQARVKFERMVRILVLRLGRSRAYRRRVQEIKEQILDSPDVQVYLESLWDRFSAAVLNRADDPDSSLRRAAAEAVLALGRALSRDPAMQARLNARIEETAVRLLVPWRHQIRQFLADVVRGWDTGTVTDRLELTVGRDLQYVRINGTLVGALVGCTIFLVAQLVERLTA